MLAELITRKECVIPNWHLDQIAYHTKIYPERVLTENIIKNVNISRCRKLYVVVKQYGFRMCERLFGNHIELYKKLIKHNIVAIDNHL